MTLYTHSVALDGVKFEGSVVLRASGGIELAPTTVEEASGGGHHRSAVLIFPPLARPWELRIVVKNVGGVVERLFRWEVASR